MWPLYLLILLLVANPKFPLPKRKYAAARIGVRGFGWRKSITRVINQGAHTHTRHMLFKFGVDNGAERLAKKKKKKTKEKNWGREFDVIFIPFMVLIISPSKDHYHSLPLLLLVASASSYEENSCSSCSHY
ncbi:hypothetical protein F5Y06DRAFT_100339 [Hypoxylon sp. FL0890]|nr:hypothetical protein F5Y06DRAFT_100339 [Hypoxylon sp. FL0890]